MARTSFVLAVVVLQIISASAFLKTVGQVFGAVKDLSKYGTAAPIAEDVRDHAEQLVREVQASDVTLGARLPAGKTVQFLLAPCSDDGFVSRFLNIVYTNQAVEHIDFVVTEADSDDGEPKFGKGFEYAKVEECTIWAIRDGIVVLQNHTGISEFIGTSKNEKIAPIPVEEDSEDVDILPEDVEDVKAESYSESADEDPASASPDEFAPSASLAILSLPLHATKVSTADMARESTALVLSDNEAEVYALFKASKFSKTFRWSPEKTVAAALGAPFPSVVSQTKPTEGGAEQVRTWTTDLRSNDAKCRVLYRHSPVTSVELDFSAHLQEMKECHQNGIVLARTGNPADDPEESTLEKDFQKSLQEVRKYFATNPETSAEALILSSAEEGDFLKSLMGSIPLVGNTMKENQVEQDSGLLQLAGSGKVRFLGESEGSEKVEEILTYRTVFNGEVFVPSFVTDILNEKTVSVADMQSAIPLALRGAAPPGVKAIPAEVYDETIEGSLPSIFLQSRPENHVVATLHGRAGAQSVANLQTHLMAAGVKGGFRPYVTSDAAGKIEGLEYPENPADTIVQFVQNGKVVDKVGPIRKSFPFMYREVRKMGKRVALENAKNEL